MPELVVSVLLERLEQISPGVEGLPLHGANLQVAKILGNLVKSPELGWLELFVPPTEYIREGAMASIAERVLPAERKGKGVLRFFSLYDLPTIWADGVPRILLCLSPDWLTRDRYLRDRFATGPMPISCQFHASGTPSLYQTVSEICAEPPVQFDVITCLSEAARESLRIGMEIHSGPNDLPCRLATIPNAVEISKFRPHSAVEKTRARELLGLPASGVASLFVGRLSPHFKADLLPLIRQFAEVSGPDHLLWIVGPENAQGYAAKLQEEGRRLGLGDRLTVRTGVDPWVAPALYGAADIFVFPGDNIQETLGNTVLEAMASGLPVIASDWDGIRDTVQHERTGLLAPTLLLPGLDLVEAMTPAAPPLSSYLMAAQAVYIDPNAMRSHLTRLLGSAKLRAKMGAAGRAAMEAGYTWQTIEGKLVTLWRELLGEAAKEAPENRKRRRFKAERLTERIPYSRILAPYASSKASAKEYEIGLSQIGASIMDGVEKLDFYDELLPVLRAPLVDHLLRSVAVDPAVWRTIAHVADHACATTGFSHEEALYHIAILIKRGVFDLREVPQANGGA